MRSDRHLGFVAAAATLLAAAPMSAIFDRWTWLVQCAVAVALISASALLARRLRFTLWGQGLVMAAALLLALTWLFPAGGGLLGLLPTPGTLAHFAELATRSVEEMRSYGVPVQDTDPLLFITVLGVGAVAIVVDLCAVGLRRPALAGLPMLAIYSVPVAVYPDSVPPAPFIIGASGFLWLLVADNIERVRQFGRRFTGDGRSVDVWEPSPLAAAGRRLAVLGVVLAVLLPLGVPGMTSGPLSRLGGGGNGTGPGGPGGGPGQINLFAALSGQLNQSEVHELVTVTTTEPEPFYLRFGVADELRPDGFAVGRPSGSRVGRGLPDAGDESLPAGVTQRRFQATVEVTDDFNMPLLPVYTDLVELRDVDSAWRYDTTKQIVFAEQARSRGKRYSFDYVRSTYSPATLEAARPLPGNDPLREFIEVPQRIPQVSQLVAKLTETKRTDYARVRAIYDYFSRENNFSYSLSTEGGTSGQDIVDFLDQRVGFCQQYAAALAWLVRVAGIPARVAFGFSNGSERRGNTYTLTNLNLHAWTEVYFTGIGWVPFDATPMASVPGSVRSAWAPDTDAPDDPVASSAAPSPGAAGPDSSAPGGDRRTERNIDEGMEGAAGPGQQDTPAWPWWTLVAVLLGFGLLAVPALRRAALRRRRYRQPAGTGATVVGDDGITGGAQIVLDRTAADRADAHAAWDELTDTLVDYRLRVDLTRSPRTVAEQLVKRYLSGTSAADAVRLLGRAEERARYAREPLAGAPLGEALTTVGQELRAGADRRTRLTATLLPPSVLARWRAAVVDSATRLIGWGSRLRDALARWSPRRLLSSRVSR